MFFSRGGEHKSTHVHCYLQLLVKSTIANLRPLVEQNVGLGEAYTGSIHLSSIKSRKSWIKYITKEDPLPAFRGVDTSLFHFAYRMHSFISSNSVFDSMAPFIRQNINYARLVEKSHTDYWANEMKKAVSKTRRIVPDETVPWVRDGLEALRGGRHVLIEGETGLGKSVMSKWFAESKYNYEGVVMLPCSESGFEFSNVNHSSVLVIADDISAQYFVQHRQTLLRLLDGGLLSINPKCEQIRHFVCKAQFIFCTNFSDVIIGDAALNRRIQVIKSDVQGWRSVEGLCSGGGGNSGGVVGEYLDDVFAAVVVEEGEDREVV